MLHRLYILIIKELISYFRDTRMRAILIGPPLAQLLVFSFAVTLEVRNVDVAVLDQDSGQTSTQFVERLQASSFVRTLIPVHDMATMTKLIDERKVLLGIRFTPNFSRDILAGDTGVVQVLLDGRRANAAQIVLNYTTALAAKLGASLAPNKIPRDVVVRHWFNPNLSYRWFIVPSLSGVLALTISLLITGLSIARERELGTFDQLLVSPISPTEIIIGKTIPAVIIGAVLGLTMIAAGILIFRVPFTGSVTLLALALPLFILSSVGIGLSISAISNTQQQAILGVFAAVIPIILTSGFATPVENMPGWLQTVSMANPLRYYLVIVQGSFLKALPPAEVLANALPLVIIAMVSLLFSVWFVKSRLQ